MDLKLSIYSMGIQGSFRLNNLQYKIKDFGFS